MSTVSVAAATAVVAAAAAVIPVPTEAHYCADGDCKKGKN